MKISRIFTLGIGLLLAPNERFSRLLRFRNLSSQNGQILIQRFIKLHSGIILFSFCYYN